MIYMTLNKMFHDLYDSQTRCSMIYSDTFLLSLQSFPYLLKEMAEFVTLLPKEGQDAVLDDMHAHVAESDDVTRKPVLVSWLQSLSYISSQSSCSESHSKATG